VCVPDRPIGAIGSRGRDSERDAAIAPDLDVVDFRALRTIRRAEVQTHAGNRGVQIINPAESLVVHGFLEGAKDTLHDGKRRAWYHLPDDQIALAALDRHPANDLLLCIKEI
jgi:hypothetical protein